MVGWVFLWRNILFDRPDSQSERAILVHIQFSALNVDDEDLAEFEELVTSAGVAIADIIVGTRKVPDAKYFIGSGKMEEIQQAINLHDADVVLFNHALSPAQQRNIEKKLETRVIDRTGLILDIFAQRAQTFEGKLQVELAQLEHLSTRLIHGWTHLERQKGGVGLRGPGETQLESDRRLISDRIKKIKTRLEKVRSQRSQGRQARQRKPVPVVSIVGYTNAGKSTLFNLLTGAHVYAADKLFATLDPTLRRITLPEVGDVVLVDTVGFIRHLPHSLVDAFRATLEETIQADLLLHVIDFSSDLRDDNIEQVEQVLTEIGADKVPTIKVYNKIDRVEGMVARLDFNEDEQDDSAVYLSAIKNQGVELLQDVMQKYLTKDFIQDSITLTSKQAKLRAKLYELQAIQKESIDEHGNWCVDIRLAKAQYHKLIQSEVNNELPGKGRHI